MHPQLEILLQIQDLRLQQRELSDPENGREVEEQEFRIVVDDAIRTIEEKVSELEDELETRIRQRYERIATGRGRPVVPIINGTCYGCFVSIPTALASDASYNDEIRHCDNCGRFLYRIG